MKHTLETDSQISVCLFVWFYVWDAIRRATINLRWQIATMMCQDSCWLTSSISTSPQLFLCTRATNTQLPPDQGTHLRHSAGCSPQLLQCSIPWEQPVCACFFLSPPLAKTISLRLFPSPSKQQLAANQCRCSSYSLHSPQGHAGCSHSSSKAISAPHWACTLLCQEDGISQQQEPVSHPTASTIASYYWACSEP